MYLYLPVALTSIHILIPVGLGLAVGLLSGLFGVGGGFLLTPLLIMFGIPSTVAAATDSNQIVAASTSGTYAHWKVGNVDFKMGLYLLVGGFVGGIFGVQAIKVLRARGAEVGDPGEIETMGKLGSAERTVREYEFKHDLNAYLATMPETVRYRTLADLVAYNDAHADTEMPYFGQEIFISCEKRGPLTDKEYLDARAKCVDLTRTKGIDATMDKHKLDAMMGPSGGPAGIVDLVTMTGGGGGGGSSQFPAVSGYPHITVPAGHSYGLPMGISFFGRAWSEATLIRIAYAFEQATKARREPEFIPTLMLS